MINFVHNLNFSTLDSVQNMAVGLVWSIKLNLFRKWSSKAEILRHHNYLQSIRGIHQIDFKLASNL